MPDTSHLRLGVNIDHVATVRNARGGSHPDPVKAALAAIAAGADGITAHLREDRRHIRDDDIARLKAELTKPLNFEMAATREMVGIALKTRPHAVCIVPERRQEVTTEGGLDVAGQHDHLAPIVAELKAAGIRVSLFIDAEVRQIEAARAVGAPVIEIHTGAWCEAVVETCGDRRRRAAAHQAGGGPGKAARARGPCRARTRPADSRNHRGLPGDRRVEHRPFSHRRRDLRRHHRGRAGDARRDGSRRRREGNDMIIGIGSDITDIRRIEKVIERHGERFLSRIFTETERARAERRAKSTETYAKRFAAKEACAKALGTGLRAGVWWRDMGVVNLPSGRPTMRLTGGAAARLAKLTPPGHEARIDLTITDEYPLAQAFVIISAVPAGSPAT